MRPGRHQQYYPFPLSTLSSGKCISILTLSRSSSGFDARSCSDAKGSLNPEAEHLSSLVSHMTALGFKIGRHHFPAWQQQGEQLLGSWDVNSDLTSVPSDASSVWLTFCPAGFRPGSPATILVCEGPARLLESGISWIFQSRWTC